MKITIDIEEKGLNPAIDKLLDKLVEKHNQVKLYKEELDCVKEKNSSMKKEIEELKKEKELSQKIIDNQFEVILQLKKEIEELKNTNINNVNNINNINNIINIKV